MIAIIDCEIGNLRSVQKALECVGFEAIITYDKADIMAADSVVLPGVGAFRDAVDFLRKNKLDLAIKDIIASGKPFLGICLGLQLYATESEEGGLQSGLDLIKGRVIRFPDTVKVPQMGWNRLNHIKDCPIFQDVSDDAYFYFAHSYYFTPADDEVIATTTDYGIEYASAVWCDNVFGVQFHPEKSGKCGLKILENFGNLT